MANIVRLDIMEGKPRTFVCEHELENGYFLKIVGKAKNVELDIDKDYEAYAIELADADTDLGDLLFHKSVENMYDERLMKADFILPANKPGRGYIPTRNDVVTIPLALVDGLTAVDDNLEAVLYLAADGKLATTGTVEVAKVEAFEDIVVPMYKGQFGVDEDDIIQPSVVIRFTI